MKLVKAVILISLLLFPLSAFCDQTTPCPQSQQERIEACRQAISRSKKISETINKWEQIVRSPQSIIVPVDKMQDESIDAYKKRVKDNSYATTKYTNHRIDGQGIYYNSRDGLMYLAMDRAQYWNYVYEGLDRDYDKAAEFLKLREDSSNQVKETAIQAKINALRQELQEIDLFRTRCCGY